MNRYQIALGEEPVYGPCLESLAPDILKILSSSIGNKNDSQTRLNIINAINRQLYSRIRHEDEMNHVSFEVTQDNSTLNIKPNNLFTLILMDGGYVPPFILGSKTEFTTRNGQTFTMDV